VWGAVLRAEALIMLAVRPQAPVIVGLVRSRPDMAGGAPIR
jgi:hypothetical protein